MTLKSDELDAQRRLVFQPERHKQPVPSNEYVDRVLVTTNENHHRIYNQLQTDLEVPTELALQRDLEVLINLEFPIGQDLKANHQIQVDLAHLIDNSILIGLGVLIVLVRISNKEILIGQVLNSVTKSLMVLENQFHLMNFYNFKKLTNLIKTNLGQRITQNKSLSHLNRTLKLLILVQMLGRVPKNLLIELFQIVQKNQEDQIGMIVPN